MEQTGSTHVEATTHVREALRHGLERADDVLGGPARARVILVFAAVLALESADIATVGASATQLRASLHLTNADIGLLVATSSLVGAVATIPFGALVDHVRRTRLLAAAVSLWAVAMAVGALATSFEFLLLSRMFLGAVTAAAGPAIASMIGDFFRASERGRIWGLVLSGELLGAGFGFVVAGGLAELTWRASFLVLAAPAVVLAVLLHRLPEPVRGGASRLEPGADHVPTPDEAAGHEPADARDEPEDADDVRTAPTVDPRAARAVREQHIEPVEHLVLHEDPQGWSLLRAVRYVLAVRTNVVLIITSACSYFFFAGVRAFGMEFVKAQYGVGQLLASALALVLGLGAILGVVTGGRLSDRLLRRGHLDGRIVLGVVALVATAILFVPALLVSAAVVAIPLLTAAAFTLSSINPSLDAARLDIMHPTLWGRAEAVRTVLRLAVEALAPLSFGFAATVLFGGGTAGLQRAFLLMLLPVVVGAMVLLAALRTYPRDVATATASVENTCR